MKCVQSTMLRPAGKRRRGNCEAEAPASYAHEQLEALHNLTFTADPDEVREKLPRFAAGSGTSSE